MTFYQGSPIRISSLITEPKHSLIHQSFKSDERREPLNGDGFGLAWYDLDNSPEPARFRSVSPAWNNRNLRELSRVIMSKCILAHVRAATQQMEVMESNCHPFKNGAYTLMHNGEIGGFTKIRRQILMTLSDAAFQSIHGTTDSEHFFALFMDHLKGDDINAIATAMQDTITQVIGMVEANDPKQHCYFNFILTNGVASVAVRFATNPENADSLYINYGTKYIYEDGACLMVGHGKDDKAILVSSEPLTRDPGWDPIPVNHMVLMQVGKAMEARPIEY